MTNGTSQGLFIVIAVIIFGIFVLISYILFKDTMKTSLTAIFTDSLEQSSNNLDGSINIKDKNKQENDDYYFGYVKLDGDNSDSYLNYYEAKATGYVYLVAVYSKDSEGNYIQDTSGEKLTGHLNLPDKVNGKKVVAIGTNAGSQDGIWTFQSAQISSVKLPRYLQTIPTGLFNNSTNLTKIVNGLPDGITSIGVNAFTNAPLTGTIKIPDGVVEIKDNAFNKATFSGTLTIPESTTMIGNSSFANSLFDNINNYSNDLTLGENSVRTISGEYWEK